MAGKRKQGSETPKDTVVILPGIYNETLTLLAEAHEYFYRQGHEEQAEMTERERTMYASEIARITIRLSCVMAWLMARKAVHSGKITEAEATRDYRLDCKDVCMSQHIEAESLLSESLTHLLDKSFELYQRVARLDERSISDAN